VKAFTTAALTALLFAGILTLWVPDRWAVSLYQTGAFALGIAWALRFLVRPYRIETSATLIPLTATILWGAVQLALGETVHRQETWTELLKWTTNLVLFFLALQVFASPSRRERFLRAVLYFGAALSVVAIVQMYSADGRVFWLFPTEYKTFVLGPFIYHNQYAGFIELILPVAVVGALEDRRRMPACAAIAAVMYASVIAAASRAGAILATAEILVIVLIGLRRSRSPLRNRAVTLAVLASLAILFTAIAGWDVLWRRFLLADPFSVRREFLQSSLVMIRDRPALGFGLGTWSTAYPAYALRDNGLLANQAHNDWAQWAVEGGLPFLLLILAIAGRSVRPAFRSLWGIGVLAVFVHSLVDYPLQRPALAGFFFVFLAVVESARAPQKKS
jgi:O-antigen ligase